ncbi:MAG TPA: hypothetical protein VM010_02995 [Chitinophagaceae bacterium]|nr:hypothetical protein [Chitinophagaceae bacterium]
MKPILIAALLLIGTVTKSFAHEGRSVEPVVLKSFQTTFANAKEVDWSTAEDLYKAVFFLNGQYITAYYHADGTMQALIRHISASALPVILQTALKNDHKDKWVSDVLEVTSDGGVQYYTTLENADAKVILKSSSTVWNTYQKVRKD